MKYLEILLGIVPYLLLILLVLLSKFRKNGYNLMVIIMTFFSAIRYEVGSDYKSYLNILKYHDLFQIERMEYLNRIIIKCIYYIDNIYFFFPIYSVLISLFLYKGIKKLTKYKEEAMFFFVLEPNLYLTTFGSIRQAVANAICLYGLVELIEGKKIKFFFWIFIGVLFHKSAYINLVIFIIYITKIYRKKNIYIISFILLILIKYFSLSELSHILGYSNYLEKTTNYGKGIALLFLIYSFIFFIIKDINKEDRYKFINYLSYLGGLIYYLLSSIPAASRIGRYFYFPMSIVLAEYICIGNSRIKLKNKRIIFYSMIGLIYIIFLLITTKGENGGSYIPYNTIFGI